MDPQMGPTPGYLFTAYMLVVIYFLSLSSPIFLRRKIGYPSAFLDLTAA
ncbi:MAG: hypothetical protein WCG98_05895 [bacterium]